MQVSLLGPMGCTAQTRCGSRAYKMQRSHSGSLGMAGLWGFGLVCLKNEIGDRKWRCPAIACVIGRSLLPKVPD